MVDPLISDICKTTKGVEHHYRKKGFRDNDGTLLFRRSGGHKTKGNQYKNRYVEATCPQCGHNRAYKDPWKTKYAYTCLKRNCKYKWYAKIQRSEVSV